MWTHLCLHGSGQRSCPCGEHTLNTCIPAWISAHSVQIYFGQVYATAPGLQGGPAELPVRRARRKTKHPGVKLECQVLCKSFFKVLPKTFQDPSQGQKMPFMVTSVRTPRVYTAKVPFSLTERCFQWING